jgi:lipoate-protein ligase A
MAIDEAITTARVDDTVRNTLRLYRWNPSAVSIGRFQNILNEVSAEKCKENGVDIVRRITGGGTVYHDSQDEITYSAIVKEKDFGTQDVVYAYNKICNGLIQAAKMLGLSASFSPGDQRNCPNIAVNGKKISGSAQYHKGGILLQHGTFLLDANLPRMFTYLRVPWARTVEEIVCLASDRITSVRRELKRDIPAGKVAQCLIDGFQKALQVEFEEGTLTENEQELACKLRDEKYSRDTWNFKGEA